MDEGDDLVKKIRVAIEEGNTFEELQTIAEEDWPEEAFAKVRIVEGDILSAPKGVDLAIITSSDLKLMKGIARRYRERFGGIEALQAQGKGLGEVACLVSSISVPSNTDIVKDERCVWYILAEKEPLELTDMNTLYRAICQLKEKMEVYGRTKVALPVIPTHCESTILKMLELIFSKSRAKVYVYKQENKRQQEGKDKTPPDQQAPSKGKKRTSKTRQGLIVKSNGQTYVDLVKSLKSNIDLENVDVEISRMRKTQGGDLLLEVDKGKVEELQSVIAKQSQRFQVIRKTQRTVLHIRGMDNETNEQDIMKALEKYVGEEAATCKVSSLRPAEGDCQNATIIANCQLADKLADKGKLRIGLVHCQIYARRDDVRGRKCWAKGHNTEKCTGPDRTKLCFRCGAEGHKSRQCKNNPFCPICNKEGHQVGRKGCSGGLPTKQ
nr:unnamed protein product [Callosobruchus analis]